MLVPAQPLFDSSTWASWLYQLSLPSGGFAGFSSVQLLAASPADGHLTTADLSTVTAALQAECETFPTVTAVTYVQQAVTPSTA